MSVLLKEDFKIVASRINDFSVAWNNKDLNGLAKFISEEIIFSNPQIKFSFFTLKRKSIQGRFNFLRYCNQFFEKYNTIEEVLEVIHVKENGYGHSITCHSHNKTFGVSSTLSIELCSLLLVQKMTYSNITKYRSHHEVSMVSLLIKQLKLEYFN